jgi:hypothetical protein
LVLHSIEPAARNTVTNLLSTLSALEFAGFTSNPLASTLTVRFVTTVVLASRVHDATFMPNAFEGWRNWIAARAVLSAAGALGELARKFVVIVIVTLRRVVLV